MNIFWRSIRRSILEKATSLLFSVVFSRSAKSKNRYRHLTKVDGSDVEVIIWNEFIINLFLG